MSGSNEAVIAVRANAKRNGITTLIIGGVALLVGTLWLVLLPEWLFLAGIFVVSGALVTLLIGWFKLREPEHSLLITPHAIRYLHRSGNWLLEWDNIQRFGCPRIRRGLDHLELEMIALRIKDYGPFIQSLSPRLATHLLMEQRPLLLQKDDDNCATGACYNQDFLDDTHFKLGNGEVLSGVQAMIANRMKQLRAGLGYDVFIAANELDRSPQAFIQLLHECQNTRTDAQL